MTRLKRKLFSLKNKFNLLIIRYSNRKKEFIYNGDVLSSEVKISMSPISKCQIGNIWAGAGKVKLNIYESGELYIGSNVCMNSNVYILCRKSIFIGNDVMFGPNVVVIDHDHDYTDIEWKDLFISDEIYIGSNVWIGANVTILRGTYIGDNCVIGAGMTIKGRYDANTVYYSDQNIKAKRFRRI